MCFLVTQAGVNSVWWRLFTAAYDALVTPLQRGYVSEFLLSNKSLSPVRRDGCMTRLHSELFSLDSAAAQTAVIVLANEQKQHE